MERPILFNGPMVRAILDGRKSMMRWVIKPQPPTPAYKLCTCMSTTGDQRQIGKHHWVLLKSDGFTIVDAPAQYFGCPLGYEGDVLYVRENAYIAPPNFADPMPGDIFDDKGRHRTVGYTASMDSESVRCAQEYGVKQRPSIHMPRWASRITLRITDVCVERLQEITEEDAKAEGIERVSQCGMLRCCGWKDYSGKSPGFPLASYMSAVQSFRTLWDSIYAKPAPVYTRVDGKRVIDHYVSYPWEDMQETRVHKGKPWHVHGNPWVWVTGFEREVEG